MAERLSATSEARLAALTSAHHDRWVALSADETRIVAEGTTFEETVVEAERNGEADPLIVRVPHEWTPRVF